MLLEFGINIALSRDEALIIVQRTAREIARVLLYPEREGAVFNLGEDLWAKRGTAERVVRAHLVHVFFCIN